eukprot:gene13266-13396_t
MCPEGCNIPVRLANGTETRSPLNKCTDDGTSTGHPVPALVDSGNACTSDEDCKKQNPVAWCSLSSTTAQQVTLSAEANEIFTDCSEIFTLTTMEKLGVNALCSVPDGAVKELEIKLMDVSDFQAVLFDASSSYGTAAAPLISITWEMVLGTSSLLSAAISRVNNETAVMDQVVLPLDGVTLADSPAGKYTLLVTVNYLWTCTAADSTSCKVPSAAAVLKSLRLDPADLVAFKLGTRYTFSLAAGFSGSSQAATDSVVVRLARSPLVSQMTGPMGAVGFGKPVTFDASGSKDPDNPAASLGFKFTCDPQPCFNDTSYRGTNAKRSTWAIDTKQLTVNKEYTISVTVSGTAAANDDRTATASLVIRPEAGNPPTGTIFRFCGFDPVDYSALPCAAKHNPTQDLILNLDLDDGFEEATVEWSSSSVALQENTNAVGLKKTTLVIKARDANNKPVFPIGSLKLTATLNMPGIKGSASTIIMLNSAPACPKLPCFATDVNSTVFPAYTFVGSVNGWMDPDGDSMLYEFGEVTDSGYVARDPAGPSTSYVFKGFQPGKYQLYACAIDTYNARTCSSVSVTVNKPVAETAAQMQQLVQDSVAKIDVAQLASTGDVSAVTAALNEFASIASFAATATTTTGSSTGSSGSSTSPAAAAPPDPVVVAKQNALLTTLTSVINTKDPASMSSTLNAVGAVSSSATTLSGAAGTALLDVVDGFVSANKGSKTTDISSAQGLPRAPPGCQGRMLFAWL